jgi:hypothetical protein
MAQFPQNPVVGPKQVLDGQQMGLRAERTGGLVIQQMHGTYTEESLRGATWTVSTAIAGVTCTGSCILSAVNAMPIIGLFNPVGSGKNLVIQKVVVVNAAVTANSFVWGSAALPAMTNTTGGKVGVNHLTYAVGGHQAGTFIGATAMIGTPIVFRYIGGQATGAVGTGVASGFTEYVDGDIVVQPGNFLGMFVTIVMTTAGPVASLTWSELPQ